MRDAGAQLETGQAGGARKPRGASASRRATRRWSVRTRHESGADGAPVRQPAAAPAPSSRWSDRTARAQRGRRPARTATRLTTGQPATRPSRSTIGTISGNPRSASAAGGAAGNQASCECEWGSEAPASWPSLMNGKQMPPRSSCARRCHASATWSSVVGDSFGDRVHVLRAVHHDLLQLEGRVEVRHDAHVPAGRPVAEAERLGRRPVFVAGAERAVLTLIRGDRRCARPARAPRRDCQAQRPVDASRRRSATLGAGLAEVSPPARNGRSISIGIGKTIVVDCDGPSSSSALQVAQLQRDRMRLDHHERRPSTARRPGTRPRR